MPLNQLPCGGCRYCTQRQKEWADFEVNVEDVLPLSKACRQVQTRSMTKTALGATHDQPQVESPREATSSPEPSNGQAAKPTRKETTWAEGVSVEEMVKAQEGDMELAPVRRWLTDGKKPNRDEAASLSPGTRCYWLNFELLELTDGVVYLRWVDPMKHESVLKLVVPSSLRTRILTSCHDSLFSGHLGVRKTIGKIKQRFYWPHLSAEVKLHIRTCTICSTSKSAYKSYRAALANFRVGAPMDRIAIDVMGPISMSSSGNKYVFVIADYFTRWVEAFAIPDQKAETVAKKLVLEFVCRFGAPLELHSDQGRNFESNLFKEVCRLLEVTKTRTTPFHPSSNGVVERFNRTLAGMIRCYLEDGSDEWDLYLPILTAAYRGTVHPSTGFTPNYLMLGREVSMPVDTEFPPVNLAYVDAPSFALDLQQRLAKCYDQARVNLQQAAERQKKYHDTRIVQHTHIPGQLVLKRNAKTSKFDSPWVGPYVVKSSLSDCLYVIEDKKKSYVVHHDLLKPHQVSDPPTWVKGKQGLFSARASL